MNKLEKARHFTGRPKSSKSYKDEDIKVAIAWAKGEISLEAVKNVMGKRTNQSVGAYIYLAMAFREGVRRGLVTT